MNQEETQKVIQSINYRFVEMKVIVIRFNVRYKDKASENKPNEIFYGNNLAGQLLKDYRLLPDTMLMDYDVEGICQYTGRDIVYDRGIIKTYKPLEYWQEHFKTK